MSTAKRKHASLPGPQRESLSETVQRMNYQYVTTGTLAVKDVTRVLGNPRQKTSATNELSAQSEVGSDWISHRRSGYVKPCRR